MRSVASATGHVLHHAAQCPSSVLAPCCASLRIATLQVKNDGVMDHCSASLILLSSEALSFSRTTCRILGLGGASRLPHACLHACLFPLTEFSFLASLFLPLLHVIAVPFPLILIFLISYSSIVHLTHPFHFPLSSAPLTHLLVSNVTCPMRLHPRLHRPLFHFPFALSLSLASCFTSILPYTIRSYKGFFMYLSRRSVSQSSESFESSSSSSLCVHSCALSPDHSTAFFESSAHSLSATTRILDT
jgi:hypothetical protein